MQQKGLGDTELKSSVLVALQTSTSLLFILQVLQSL